MRFGTGFGLDHIFVSHLHADHYLGIIGLIQTMATSGARPIPFARLRARPTPKPTLQAAVRLGRQDGSVPRGDPGAGAGRWGRRGWLPDRGVRVRHGTNPRWDYALREDALGRAGSTWRRPACARDSGGSPLRSTAAGRVGGGGRSNHPGAVRGGGTRPVRGGWSCTRAIPGPARGDRSGSGADLLVHDATFSDEEADRARETFHSTARGAAEVAVRPG
jgi:ribonuclease Z